MIQIRPLNRKSSKEDDLNMAQKSSPEAVNTYDTPASLTSVTEQQVGEQIRELRRLKRMTLEQLADAVGISTSYMSQIERNRAKLPIGTLRSICDALGVHITWFFPADSGGAPEERHFIVRAKNRRRMSFTGLGINEELLTPNLSGAA